MTFMTPQSSSEPQERPAEAEAVADSSTTSSACDASQLAPAPAAADEGESADGGEVARDEHEDVVGGEGVEEEIQDEADENGDDENVDSAFLDFLYFEPSPEKDNNKADEERWMKELEGDDEDNDVSSTPVEEIWSGIVGGMSKVTIQQEGDGEYADFMDCLDKEEEEAGGEEGEGREATFAAFVEFFESPEAQAVFATEPEGVTAELIWGRIVDGMAEEGAPWYVPIWTRLGLYSPSECFKQGGVMDDPALETGEDVSPWLNCFRAWFAARAREQAEAMDERGVEEEGKECEDLEDGLQEVSPV